MFINKMFLFIFPAMLVALDKSESHGNCSKELMKASEKLCKVLTEADIRLLVDNIGQKSGAEMCVLAAVLLWYFTILYA